MIHVLPPHRKLERFALTCPLGLRFRDAATRTLVTEGLRVEAFIPDDPYRLDPRRRWPAVANRSGAFTFHHLPGMREFEHSVDDEQRWTRLATPRTFQVEVADSWGRFIPLRFGVVAPERILAEPADASSPPSFPLRTVDLYSAPARPVPGGCAVVRADLAEWDSGRPAAWAMVQIESELVRATGLADGAGHLALMFPYPEAVEALASPLNGPGLLLEQSWTLRFRVWHTFDARPGAAADLDSLLSRATGPESDGLWSGGSPPFPFEVAELLFGRELVVPAGGPGDSRQLWITPAGSPP